MLTKENFRDLMTYILIIGILILALLILRPIINAIIYGILFSYVFYPVYIFIKKYLKYEFLSAFIVCLGLFLIIGVLISIIIGTLLDEIIQFYLTLSGKDFSNDIYKILSIFPLPTEITSPLVDNIRSSISNLLFNFLDKSNEFILDLPIIALKLIVFIFVFFFCLKDGDKAIEYIKSISPFKKDVQERFFKRFKNITNSVLLGQVFVGIIQGLVAGIGFFIFNIPNTLLLTFLSIITSIIPMLGPWLIWLPINILLFTSGNSEIAIGFLIYNLFFTSLIDNVLRPFIISKRTEINSAIIIIGMVGGFLVMGILGLIVGPLILAYILLMLDVYKNKGLEEDIS